MYGNGGTIEKNVHVSVGCVFDDVNGESKRVVVVRVYLRFVQERS